MGSTCRTARKAPGADVTTPLAMARNGQSWNDRGYLKSREPDGGQ